MTGRRLALLMLALLPLSGCARTGSATGGPIPEWTIRFIVKLLGPVRDNCHYFIAIAADNNFGSAGPVPVVRGPNWGNGWGTGSITHYIWYNQGRYGVYRASFTVTIKQRGGGIADVTGSPAMGRTGNYTLTVGDLTLGSVSVSGTGPVTAATNQSDQNAGTFSIGTDAAGRTIAGGVTFTPADNGGRAPNVAETTALEALNAGGVLLAPDSLSAFGLTLTIGAPAAGTQTLEVQPTVAEVRAHLAPDLGSPPPDRTGTVTANSTTSTANPPIPGLTLTTHTLEPGGQAELRSVPGPPGSEVFIQSPYQSVPPYGGTQLDVTIDQAVLGAGVDNISVNIITTTQLIVSAGINDPPYHCYDGLGVSGTRFVNFNTGQTRVLTNQEATEPEGPNDRTVWDSTAIDDDKRGVDIVDWTIMVQRLGG